MTKLFAKCSMCSSWPESAFCSD